MELKLARETLRSEGKMPTITLEAITKMLEENGRKGVVIYLDRENSEKDIKKLESHFQGKKRDVLKRKLCYSMDSKDFIHEVHIL